MASSRDNPSNVEQRKADHLRICLNENVNSTNDAGWAHIRLPHCALPELNFEEVSVETQFLGKKFSSPFLISSMTGGTDNANALNLELADFASRNQIPMGLGSQRIAVEDPQKAQAFALKKKFPKLTLWANLGAVQLNYGVNESKIQKLLDEVQADALILHLNALQECIQKEGDRNFSGLKKKIEVLCKKLPVPVIVKETGCGLDLVSAKGLVNAGVSALDVAGMGGTHWGYIEGRRQSSREALGTLFRDWGVPTPTAIGELRSHLPKDYPLIGSGGIRDGLEATKAIFVGANLVGMAAPFLRAAQGGQQGLQEFLDTQIEAMRIALFCMGKASVSQVRERTEKQS